MDDVLLGMPSIFLEPGFHILRVVLDERGERHIRIAIQTVERFFLPFDGVALILEAALLALLHLACPIDVAIDDTPSVVLLVLVYRHQ